MKYIQPRVLVASFQTAVLLTTLVAITHNLSGQNVTCSLHQESGNRVAGKCKMGDEEALPVALVKSAADKDVLWEGSLMIGGREAPFDIVTYEYQAGSEIVIRTPFGWFLPTDLQLDGEPLLLTWNTKREAPPSQLDRSIMEQARSLIRDGTSWDRADDRICDPLDTTYSLYCALAEATRRVAGEYQHRQPALQFVREVVAEKWHDRIQNHRLMDFNNDESTTFADLNELFDIVLERIDGAVR